MIWFHLLLVAAHLVPALILWLLFSTALGGVGSAVLIGLMAWIGHRYGDRYGD